MRLFTIFKISNQRVNVRINFKISYIPEIFLIMVKIIHCFFIKYNYTCLVKAQNFDIFQSCTGA